MLNSSCISGIKPTLWLTTQLDVIHSWNWMSLDGEGCLDGSLPSLLFADSIYNSYMYIYIHIYIIFFKKKALMVVGFHMTLQMDLCVSCFSPYILPHSPLLCSSPFTLPTSVTLLSLYNSVFYFLHLRVSSLPSSPLFHT